MEQRDYILREIEKISILIQALMGRLKKIVLPVEFEAAREMVDREMEEGSGISINRLIGSDEEEVKSMLSGMKAFNHDNTEQLALLLVEFSRVMDATDRIRSLEKALLLLEWVDKEGKTFSFERQAWITEIKRQAEVLKRQ